MIYFLWISAVVFFCIAIHFAYRGGEENNDNSIGLVLLSYLFIFLGASAVFFATIFCIKPEIL